MKRTRGIEDTMFSQRPKKRARPAVIILDDDTVEKKTDEEGTDKQAAAAAAAAAAIEIETKRLERVAQRRALLIKWQQLTMDQREALRTVLAGRENVYILGSAGAGKSFLLDLLVAWIGYLGQAAELAVTAPTGIAATHIRGTTLHWFMGIGQGKEEAHVLVRRVRKNEEACERIRAIRRLVIDEVSMLGPALMDKVDRIMRVIRGVPDQPFGGVQVILSGDFLQLPPVFDKDESSATKSAAPLPATPASSIRFAFQSRAWAELRPRLIELCGSLRQNDAEFLAILNELRRGECSAETEARLRRLMLHSPTQLGERVTQLYPYNRNVDEENGRQLEFLSRTAQVRDYHAVDVTAKKAPQGCLDKLRVPKLLQLCVGARVMLLQNLSVATQLANGTQGTVMGFGPAPNFWPMVQFEHSDGASRVIRISAAQFKITSRGKLLAQRDQVPLMLAWALTIHKSQGMTITGRVQLDLGRRVFEAGQAYVALSRLTSLENARLVAFDRAAIRADPVVLAWLATNLKGPTIL